MEIAGKTALVTGSAARVGRELALALARCGADVLVHYNQSADAASETVAAARQLGVRSVAVQADLGSIAGQQRLARQALGEWGRVDIVVHAASPFVRGTLSEVTPEDFQLLMAVGVESLIALAKGLAPGMADRGEGVFVVILDRGVIDPWPDYLAHGVAKSALWALARTLAVELAPDVRVNGIVPGPVLPPPGMPDPTVRRLAEGTLLRRWGGAQSVAEAMLYLVRADFVTGEMLFVDGGERWTHRRRAR